MAMIGEDVDLTYPAEYLGEGIDALAGVLKKDSSLLKKLQEAKRPAIIVGPGVLNRPDRAAVMQKVYSSQFSHASKQSQAHRLFRSRQWHAPQHMHMQNANIETIGQVCSFQYVSTCSAC